MSSLNPHTAAAAAGVSVATGSISPRKWQVSTMRQIVPSSITDKDLAIPRAKK